MFKLHADCLKEILEYLEDDGNTLYSCLLVNRLWCVISVKILWRSIRNYRTLITSLPDESKKILIENGISITTSKPLLFNYVIFCRCISYHELNINIERLLKKQQSISILQSSKDNIKQEIIKFLMRQIISLRKLIIPIEFSTEKNMKTFTTHLKSRNRLLNDLSELHFYTDTYPKFIHQLIKVCHNIQTLKITSNFEVISNEYIDLISVQKNLKYLYLKEFSFPECKNLLTKIPNTLIKFALLNGTSDGYRVLCEINNLSNLQEFEFSYYNYNAFNDDWWDCSNILEGKLSCLNEFYCPVSFLIKFLENNGENLKRIHLNKNYHALNHSICENCKNVRILNIELTNISLFQLSQFFEYLPFLESVKINMYSQSRIKENRLLGFVAKKSPKNFCELKLIYCDNMKSTLIPEELELFLTSWGNRVPKKLLSLVITGPNSFIENDGNMKVIEKYIILGTIKLVN
ncbi:hypothetical protein RclHR1_00340032 [Rhizophagus clarus]|uniref:F-box domain-containing protein n=1 Tax=Rhizophagus clarus TaxID=94130 RepID=A0A2Z6RR96_9GLOM|nr:hypothetical protein RclHR1_00340032 [Rhizophagus clarus]GES92844.1 hypothetical protein GLOIN_2v1774990 [Rhizophagus clarus]